jgi:protein TonB
MEIKKSKKADLEGGKTLSLLMGIVIALAIIFVGFEWGTREVTIATSDAVADIIAEEEIEITRPEDTPPPPPPPPAPVVVEEEEESSQTIFTVVEKMPEFPGGETELLKFINKQIKYPVIAQENGIQGRVICTFVVNRDGSVVDAEVIRGVDPNLDKEALRVIGTMPKWKPGEQRGKPVRVKYTIPLTFRLQ